MAAKAFISTGWKVRVGAMAFLLMGMGGWFLMDGFVGYPAQQRIYLQYKLFEADHQGMDDATFIEAWNKHADAKGLPPITRDRKALDHYNKDDGSILTQKLLGFGVMPLALATLAMFIRQFTRYIASEDDGVRLSNGRHIPWNAIIKLDKTRWPRKGIAFLHYKIGEAAGRVRIDDFWYDRVPTDQIVRDIEANLKDQQIVGDIRETERDQRKAAKQAEAQAAAGGDAAKANA